MEKLLDVIERKDALVIALSDGHIRAVDLTALKPETEAEMSAEELCAAGRSIRSCPKTWNSCRAVNTYFRKTPCGSGMGVSCMRSCATTVCRKFWMKRFTVRMRAACSEAEDRR